MTKLKYLGSVIQSYGKIDKDIMYRIQPGWLKWRGKSSHWGAV